MAQGLASHVSSMLSLTHALDPWRHILTLLEVPDWLHASQSSAPLLHSHRADLPNLLQTHTRGPPATLLGLIDAGCTSRLWCVLTSSPSLANLPVDNLPLTIESQRPSLYCPACESVIAKSQTEYLHESITEYTLSAISDEGKSEVSMQY